MSRALLSCLIWSFVLIAAPLGGSLARADEFALIPLSDPIYKHLSRVQATGWTGAAQKAQPETPNQELTRYEIALETAKAIFTVNARNRTDTRWASTVSKPTLRSLRELTVAMRGELKKLDIDYLTVVQLIDKLLKPAVIGATPVKATVGIGPSLVGSVPGITGATPNSAGNTFLSDSPAPNEFRLSQNLRVQTVLSSLAREAQDPLSKSQLSIAQAGAALDVTPWLTVRAGQERQLGRRGQFSLGSPLMNDADLMHTSEATVTGGGIDIAVRPGFTFSGNLARVAPTTGDGTPATRLEGGVGLSGWQNRLVLSANVSRLMQHPEDSVALTTTAAKLNLDVGLTERLSLKLLYQQLFGAQPQRQANRVVAGGFTINF